MYKVLAADDEPLVLEGLGMLVDWAGLGFKLTSLCKNGGEVMKLLGQECFDLVITDIRMPVLDGIKLISKISSRWPATKVIIISGFNEFEYARQALEYGVKGFVVKPIDRFELTKLLKKIRTELDDESGKRNSIEKLWDFTWSSDALLAAVESCDTDKIASEIGTLLEELKRKQLTGLNMEVLFYAILSRINALCKKYSFDYGDNADKGLMTSYIRMKNIQALCGYLLSLCGRLAEHIAENERSICPDVITDIKKYIDNNYKENLHLKKIAKNFYLNPIYLGRIFKKLTGETFNSYLNKRRIIEAKRLLAGSGMKINEIIEAIGYNNPEYFYRVFKRYEGITFSEYRDNIGK